MSDSTLRGFEGVYQLANGTRLEVRARDGVLYANDWALVPVGGDRFHSLRDFGDVVARRDAAGRVERLDWGVTQGVMPAPRLGDLPEP
jgi:hypothetical protein